jgi:Na+-transporting methylmalonyl-CoA/oxaloacetate decarboxylase beta subunit
VLAMSGLCIEANFRYISNMGNSRKIILLVILGILLVCGIIFVFHNLPLLSSEASSVAVIGGVDGPTTIYIGATVNWRSCLFCLLILIVIDLIALIIKKIIDYRRKKKNGYKKFILFVLIFNFIAVLLLFPFMIIHLLVLYAVIALIYLIILFLKKKKVK